MKIPSFIKAQIVVVIGIQMTFSGMFVPLDAQAAIMPTPQWIKEKISSTVTTSEVKAENLNESTGIELASVLGGNSLLATNTPETIEANPIRYGTSKFRVQVGTTFDLTVTAYSSTVDQCDSDPFTTASGTTVHDGTVAANFLPFGTHVIFPDYSGNKVYTIEDRTNAKYSSRADIWMVSRGSALQFGKRHLKMVVVE